MPVEMPTFEPTPSFGNAPISEPSDDAMNVATPMPRNANGSRPATPTENTYRMTTNDRLMQHADTSQAARNPAVSMRHFGSGARQRRAPRVDRFGWDSLMAPMARVMVIRQAMPSSANW